MNLTDLIKAAEDYEQNVIYSDLNMEVRFGCDCCGGDFYTHESWTKMCDAYDLSDQAWSLVCKELKIPTDTYATLLMYQHCRYAIDEDDPELEDILDYLQARRELEKLLCH
jgi:hypothetical protein